MKEDPLPLHRQGMGGPNNLWFQPRQAEALYASYSTDYLYSVMGR